MIYLNQNIFIFPVMLLCANDSAHAQIVADIGTFYYREKAIGEPNKVF